VVRGELDASPLEVSEDDVGGPDDGLMSLVTGGLVLVIVAVVVGVDDPVAVAENDGSTKFRGACSGSLDWRATNVTATIRRPATASPSTLAPRTAGVRLCQGPDDGVPRSSSSESWPVTATDSSRGMRGNAGQSN
jgi:hypothetical protein